MNRKIIHVMLALILAAALLTGCQLARTDGLSTENSRLVGVFITREYLDLFDVGGYFEDNVSKLLNGGEISLKDSERYSGRIYAELVEAVDTNDETGEKHSRWDYAFPGLEGIPFFSAEVFPPDGDPFHAAFTDGLLCDTRFAVGNETTLDGTLYLTPEVPAVIYANPVYQSSDGRVFVTTGAGWSVSSENGSGEYISGSHVADSVFSTTLEETHTSSENGEKKTAESFRVTLNVGIMLGPKAVAVIQLDAQNTVITRDEYSPEDMPEQITPRPETEYIVVETESAGTDDGRVFSRELLEPADAGITGYKARTDGIIEPVWTELLWEAGQ